jgi:hypothetical protein
VGLNCTFNLKTSNVLARCKAKYCRPCLKNRYGQDLDEIKGRSINGTSKETAGHDKTQGYIFKHVTSQVTSCASSSHSLAFLDAHAALATAIVVGAVKPWVLSLPGTQGFTP